MTQDPPRFPYFSEAPTPPGAEGWQSLYPYFLVPAEETQEEENSRLWFADTMHWSRFVTHLLLKDMQPCSIAYRLNRT